MQKSTCTAVKKPPASFLRKSYMVRLVGRCLVFLLCIQRYLARPEEFEVLEGFNFFQEFVGLHLLWIIWVIDMLCQLMPIKRHIPLGSQKLFAQHFRPIREKINPVSLKNHMVATTKAAYKVFVLWVALIAVIGLLYARDVIGKGMLFLISVFFYVCDLICVLIWCPFRLIMKNRCCTTCRIFNWDHLMMFSPLIFIPGFFTYSLVVMAVVVFLVWEFCTLLFPERFWEQSNEALQCANCTDKLCTQYCQRLRG